MCSSRRGSPSVRRRPGPVAIPMSRLRHESGTSRSQRRSCRAGLQRSLGTKVRIVSGRGERGRIVIEYFLHAELDRLYERLNRP
jgi:hypothetical protein